MPSPVGHILGGIAVGSLASRSAGWTLPVICGLAAALPDLDLLLPVAHRGPTHSLAAAVGGGMVAFAIAIPFRARVSPLRAAAAVGLALVSHALLDWLGQDSSTPRGLMALWPITSSYYISDLDLFRAVDRRYWLEGFWRRATISVLWEIVILLPVVWISRYKSLVRSSDRAAPRQPFV
jgi:inner membrane protein